MKTAIKEQYLPFPLYLVSKCFTSPNTAYNDILDIGIYNYSNILNLEPELEIRNAYTQVVYDYYKKKLPEHLLKVIDDEELIGGCYHKGFDPSGSNIFNPEIEVYAFEHYGSVNKAFARECVQYYRIYLVLQLLGVDWDIRRIELNAIRILSETRVREKRYGADALVMLKFDLIYEYYSNQKTFEEISIFAAWAAVKSLIGKADFAITTKTTILMRMLGAKSESPLEDLLSNIELRKVYHYYSKRNRIDSIVEGLEMKEFVKSSFSRNVRGRSRLFLSNKLGLEKLSIEVAKYLLKHDRKTFQEKKRSEKIEFDRFINEIVKRINRDGFNSASC